MYFDKLFNDVLDIRKNNKDLLRRLTTSAAMIAACNDSESPIGEKKTLAKEIVRVSSEIGSYFNTTDLVSDTAREILQNRSLLRHEHVVPCAYITTYILENELKEGAILDFLLRTGIRAIILKEEDAALIAANLAVSMPQNWDPIQGNPLERYELAGITNLSIR